MNQRDTVQNLRRISEKRKAQANQIQQLYSCYIETGERGALDELVRLAGEYCMPWMRNHLSAQGCFNKTEYEDALQELRIAVFVMAEKHRKQGRREPEIIRMIFKTAQHKTIDAERKIIKEKNRDVASIDGIGTIDEEDQSKRFIPEAPGAHKIVEQEEYRQLCKSMFVLYCQAFLESGAFPCQPLSLFYARVLPHMLFAIKDTKGASAKWAYERMKDRTVKDLSLRSERILHREVSRELSWCSEHMKQLDNYSDKTPQARMLGDAVYTDYFDVSKIEDWAEYCHKTTLRRTQRMIARDRVLVSIAVEYFAKWEKKMYQIIGGGEER